MKTQLYPLVISEEMYETGVESDILDNAVLETVYNFHTRFVDSGIFYEAYQIQPTDPIYELASEKILEEVQVRLMRLIELQIFEPDIDYYDPSLECVYDYNVEKFVPYSDVRKS